MYIFQNKIRYFFIFCLSFLFWGQSCSAADEVTHNIMPSNTLVQTFYHSPSYSRYKKIIVLATRQRELSGPSPSNGVFLVMAMAKHNEYVSLIRKNFQNFSNSEQRYMLSVLWANHYYDLVNNLEKESHLAPFSEKLLTPTQVKTVTVRTGIDLDILWANYFATGDIHSIKKILVFINKDRFKMMVGYEILNREFICKVYATTNKSQKTSCPVFSDLVQATKQMYPLSYKQEWLSIASVSAAMGSMDSYSHQDKLLSQQIHNIYKKDPKLNYWAKINKSL